MATPVNPNDRRPDPQVPHPDHLPRRGGPGALLWLLLLLLLIAAAWYFVGQRDRTTDAPEPVVPIGDTTPQPSQSPVSTEPASREREPRRPAPVTRDARPVSQPAPEYPAASQRAGEEGTVIVRVDVDASGTPTSVTLGQTSRSRDLDRAALRAVRGWTFEPAMRDGQAVASTVQVPVEFRMQQ